MDLPSLSVSLQSFGRDHWNLLAYVEVRNVDNCGVLEPRHMRCNPERHPGLNLNGLTWMDAWSTRLKETTWAGHDDWDCVDDLIGAGLAAYSDGSGTGIHPVVKLTPQGIDMAHALRRHKMKGGSFHDFVPPHFCDAEFKEMAAIEETP